MLKNNQINFCKAKLKEMEEKVLDLNKIIINT